jgi:hypothetical protein
MISSNSTIPIRPDPPAGHADQGEDLMQIVPVWNGILHEFRNHLTVLMAAATELRAEMPPTMALQVAEAVTETERNVQSLNSLIALVDASVRTVEPVISDLDETIDRALRLAAPSVGRRVSLTAMSRTGRKGGVKNRGTALECLLAALIVDLARGAEGRVGEGRVGEGRVGEGQTGKAGQPPRCPSIQVQAEIGRGLLTIEIESNGARPVPGSWRFLLAKNLATKVDATIVPDPDVPGYLVQFR